MNNTGIARMKNLSRRIIPFFVLLVLLVGGVIVFMQVQNQQNLRGRADTVQWFTAQSAVTQCTSGTATIYISFTNAESSRSMLVTAIDQQSSQSANLDVVGPGMTKTATINTQMVSLNAGAVTFNLRWADTPSQTDSRTAAYQAIAQCSSTPPPVCTDVSQSVCSWDVLPGVSQYHVSVIDVDSGKVVKSDTVASSSTQLVFPSEAGKTYQCSVSAENACGVGDTGKSDKSSCPVPPTVTPTPTPAVCVPDQSNCTWDSLPDVTQYTVKVIDTNTGNTIKSGVVTAPNTSFDFPSQQGGSYQCSVTPSNVCGSGSTGTGQPVICGSTPTPTPTGTPSPSPSPTPTPTPTPTVPLTGTPFPTNTPTPINTPTPFPTSTPRPTPTPYPTYTPAPTFTPVPTYTPFPTLTPVIIVRQQGPTIIYQPGQTVYVPGQTQYVQQPGKTVYLPTPTMAATGSAGTTALLGGIAAVLVTLGGLVFFIL